MERVLDRGQLEEFAERGFLLLRQVVPRDVATAATQAIDELIARESPGCGAAYFRVKRAGHDPRWREFLTDPWLDYDPVREALA